MENKSSAIRLGIFIFIGLVLIIITVFLIGNKESLFSSTFTVKAYFNSIEGLRKGASVRLSGINVGSVSDIKISSDTSGKVQVEMNLVSEISQFIKTDTKASIETEGLVGNKVVVLKVGSASAAAVQDGGTIQGVDPLGFAQIIEETKGTLEYTKEMTKNLAEIVGKVNRGEGSIGKLINADDLYNNTNQLIVSADKSLSSITTRLDSLANIVNALGFGVEKVVKNVDRVVIDIDTVVAKINRGEGLLGTLISGKSGLDTNLYNVLNNTIKITEDAKLGMARFSENMEALKRNWLFKSYFEQRGYYDKTDYENKVDKTLDAINSRLKILDDRIDLLKKAESKLKKEKQDK